jgi:hypothetical protein
MVTSTEGTATFPRPNGRICARESNATVQRAVEIEANGQI